MLEIHPLKDLDKLRTLYSSKGIIRGHNDIAVIAYDGEVLSGYCLFEHLVDRITIITLEPQQDEFLADGILRAAFHFAVENGVYNAFYKDSAPVNLLKRLKFIKNEGDSELDIDRLFSSCQNCSKDK